MLNSIFIIFITTLCVPKLALPTQNNEFTSSLEDPISSVGLSTSHLVDIKPTNLNRLQVNVNHFSNHNLLSKYSIFGNEYSTNRRVYMNPFIIDGNIGLHVVNIHGNDPDNKEYDELGKISNLILKIDNYDEIILSPYKWYNPIYASAPLNQKNEKANIKIDKETYEKLIMSTYFKISFIGSKRNFSYDSTDINFKFIVNMRDFYDNYICNHK